MTAFETKNMKVPALTNNFASVPTDLGTLSPPRHLFGAGCHLLKLLNLYCCVRAASPVALQISHLLELSLSLNRSQLEDPTTIIFITSLYM